MTRRLHVDVPAPALGGAGTVIVHGHYGRPFLVFPSERGRAWDFENNGMVDAVRPLIDDGRCKLYCVTSHDADSWSNRSLSMEDRARRHAEYEQWIVDSVLPFERIVDAHRRVDGGHKVGSLVLTFERDGLAAG